MVLRSYLETYKDLSLNRLKKILRNHYGEKNSSELYQNLTSLCQGTKETAQEFVLRVLELRQKILFLSNQKDSEDNLAYETSHIQKVFLRTVETGLQDENVRTKIRSYLQDPTISDEALLEQVNIAVSAEHERARKLRNQHWGKMAQVTQVAEREQKKANDSANNVQDELLVTLQSIKLEVAQLKEKLKEKPSNKEVLVEQPRRPSDRKLPERRNPPRCATCQEKNTPDPCQHCFICGGNNHFARGCRLRQDTKSLNLKGLLPRRQK